MSRLTSVLHGGEIDPTEVSRVRDVLIFEPPLMGRKLFRFGALLVLASAIATYGLLGDSVATVIGAMIVAPLMLPIMGLAFGISIGDRRAIVSSILVGVAGIATAIAVGFILAQGVSGSFDPTSNAQIMARTSPRLVDLAAALATGLAGAFATGRKDVSDTLPGVAIAISLVPPLTNAGILFAQHEWNLGLGSLLLFMTNYFAILLTGALVFGLMGYPKVSLVHKSLRARRLAVVVVVIMVLVIAAPLAVTTTQIAHDNAAEARAALATKDWIEGSGYRYVTAEAKNGVVQVVITGRGTVPSQESLQQSLDGQLYGMKVQVEVVPTESLEFETAAGGS